jgi:inward rectifier potassium channel
MALSRKINSRAKTENNTGFGTNSAFSGGRFVNPDGSPNIAKKGINFFERYSVYHTLLAMSLWKFLALVLLVYVCINLLFASIYYFIGIEHLGGIVSSSPLENFGEAFFFSAQTFTTVGYGRINPLGFWTSSIAAIEALLGLLSFALATGLLYGRFSRPESFLRFSDFSVIAPYEGITGLMFRISPFKNNALLDAEVKVSLAMRIEENGKMVNRFFPLDLEISKINALTLSWTIVHPIDEKSPLYNLKQEEYINFRVEILIFVKAFDEMFANTVVARTSYTANEIVFGAKFKPMYYPSDKHNKTVLDLNKLNEIETMMLPDTKIVSEVAKEMS